ncbi:MAG: J domain-containing protein [Elusimicrobia bacterium]|nr:J domain-containing protein [Elusimicrobiota bacterium]
MNTDEAYRVLGLSAPASADAVKKAYRRKALESHPDRWTDPADKAFHERLFLEAKEAYAKLRAEGYPELPEEAAVAPDYTPKTAGRSFAPKEMEDVAASEKLGLRVAWSVESIVLWGVVLPASAIALVYFVKVLIGLIRG